MCPACVATALLIASGVASAGGVAVAARRGGAKAPQATDQEAGNQEAAERPETKPPAPNALAAAIGNRLHNR